MLAKWKQEYWISIKSYDTEDKLDLYFYRPAGFFFAKLGKALRLTPDMLTVAGVFLGLAAGWYFYDQANFSSWVLGSILFVLAGVLDSSDGQLARMIGKSTKFGLVLDGLCDNIVFGAVYIGSAMTLMPIYGPSIFVLAVLAGAFHSFQSSILDFYNREYLYFGYGKIEGDYWNPTTNEAREERQRAITNKDKLFWDLRFSWIWQQNFLSTRTPLERQRLRELILSSPQTREKVGTLYRDHNRTILRFWRPLGANLHTIMIIVFCYFQRFDLYLLAVDIIGLTLYLLVVRVFQLKQDRKFFVALRAQGLW